MPSEMEEILRDVALIITDRLAKQRDFDNITIERVLRDSGLLRLLEAGQAMYDWLEKIDDAHFKEGTEWKAVKAAVKEAVRR